MNWIKQLFSRRRLYGDLNAEIQAHLAEKIEERVAGGMPREEATFAARREFGNVLQIEERSREIWQSPSLGNFFMDVRYGLRMLAKSPGFTSVAVVTLALGIGANTAIFSLINALILRSLPAHDPQQLVAISTRSPDGQNGKDPLSLSMFEEIQKSQQVFSEMFAWNGGGMINYEANGAKYAASVDTVSGDYFATLGVQPLLGRLIEPADVGLETGSSAAVAVISYNCWQRRYNGDSAIIGKTIRANDRPPTIIGVTPRKFGGLIIEAAPDAIVPVGFSGGLDFRNPEHLWLSVVGRLKADTTLEQARAQLTTLWPGIQAATLPPSYQGAQRSRFFARRIDVESFARGNSYLRERFRYQLATLMGLVGLVLLISCVNLANLTLARAAAREHEIGIRVTLGATGGRLVRQLLTESVLLSAAGALLGLALASWITRLLAKVMWTGFVPLGLDLAPDLRVLVFTTGVAGLTTVLFGMIPAWRMTRIDPAGALQQNARMAGGSAGRFNRGLVVAQVSLSLILVIGATLFVRSFENLRSLDPGYRRQGVLVMQLFPQAGHEKIPNRAAYYQELAEKLSQLPGVESVSYSHMGPAFRYEYKTPVSISSESAAPVEAVEDWMGPGVFHLLGMRVLEGREFDWRDVERTPRVAIVSESLARRLTPGSSPIGRKINVGSDADHKNLEIVGVVNSATLWKIQSHEPMAVYGALMQEPSMNQPMVDLRIAGDPQALASSARRVVESMGHHFPLRIQTVEARQGEILNMDHVVAMLSAFFGGLALLLASMGLYGVMSYAVSRRTPEIGVRRALGAQKGDILWMVTREALFLVVAGLAIGLPGALAATRVISSMLFGLKPTDLFSMCVATALMIAVALIAGYLPARRASKVDPMVALRYE